MSFFDSFETSTLRLIFNNVGISNIGDATGIPAAAAVGSLYLALHTADPGDAGNGTTNEADFTGYARLAIARSSGGWTVTGGIVSNTALAQFANCTGGANTITHVSVVATSSGTATPIVSGAVDAPEDVISGVQLKFDPGVLALALN